MYDKIYEEQNPIEKIIDFKKEFDSFYNFHHLKFVKIVPNVNGCTFEYYTNGVYEYRKRWEDRALVEVLRRPCIDMWY